MVAGAGEASGALPVPQGLGGGRSRAAALVCFPQEGQENVEILPSGERQQANQKRITTPYMTKYERARVLGTRALQIA